MIMTVLPIPPLAVRPSIQMDGSSTGEDDLTHKLFAIIKTNADVYRCAQDGTPAHLIQQHEQLLQYHVATYMDNDIAGQPPAAHKNGRPVSDMYQDGERKIPSCSDDDCIYPLLICKLRTIVAILGVLLHLCTL